MPGGLDFGAHLPDSQSPERVNRRIPLLGEGEKVAEHGQGALHVVLSELLKIGVALQDTAHARDSEAQVDRCEEEEFWPDGVVTHPGIRWFGGASYTEVEYGKSWWVMYSSTILPVAACPLGPALV